VVGNLKAETRVPGAAFYIGVHESDWEIAKVLTYEEIQSLAQFNSRGNLALSVYLYLEPASSASPAEQIEPLLQASLDRYAHDPERRRVLEEDIEMVRLYVRSNGNAQAGGLAIFSCSAEFFWRAYRLPRPVPTQVAVDAHFVTGPLVDVLRAEHPTGHQPPGVPRPRRWLADYKNLPL